MLLVNQLAVKHGVEQQNIKPSIFISAPNNNPKLWEICEKLFSIGCSYKQMKLKNKFGLLIYQFCDF